MKSFSLSLTVLLASLVTVANDGNAKEVESPYTAEYKAQLEGEQKRDVAQEHLKESREWKEHQRILNLIDRRDRN